MFKSFRRLTHLFHISRIFRVIAAEILEQVLEAKFRFGENLQTLFV